MAKKQIKFGIDTDDHKLVADAVKRSGGSLADFARVAVLEKAGKLIQVAPASPVIEVEAGSKFAKAAPFNKKEMDGLAELNILMNRRINEIYDLSMAQLVLQPQILTLLGQIAANRQ